MLFHRDICPYPAPKILFLSLLLYLWDLRIFTYMKRKVSLKNQIFYYHENTAILNYNFHNRNNSMCLLNVLCQMKNLYIKIMRTLKEFPVTTHTKQNTFSSPHTTLNTFSSPYTQRKTLSSPHTQHKIVSSAQRFFPSTLCSQRQSLLWLLINFILSPIPVG